MIPDWMKEANAGPCKCSAVSHGKKGFVGKTIDGIFSFLEEAFVSETYAKRNGLLQSLDPRAKLISILAVIFATSVIGDLDLLIFVYLTTLLFAYLSKIEVLFFIKRVWLFIPIFAGIIALPMIIQHLLPRGPSHSVGISWARGSSRTIFVAREHFHHQTRCQPGNHIHHACSDLRLCRGSAFHHNTTAGALQILAFCRSPQDLCPDAGDGLQIHFLAHGHGSGDVRCQKSQDH